MSTPMVSRSTTRDAKARAKLQALADAMPPHLGRLLIAASRASVARVDAVAAMIEREAAAARVDA